MSDKPRRGQLAWSKGTADDLRDLGWRVAVHNDYRLDDRDHTFWLMTLGVPGGRMIALKGEGRDDGDALDLIREQVLKLPYDEEAGHHHLP